MRSNPLLSHSELCYHICVSWLLDCYNAVKIHQRPPDTTNEDSLECKATDDTFHELRGHPFPTIFRHKCILNHEYVWSMSAAITKEKIFVVAQSTILSGHQKTCWSVGTSKHPGSYHRSRCTTVRNFLLVLTSTVCLGLTNNFFPCLNFLCLIWHVIKRYGRELSAVRRWASNSQYWWSYGTLNF